MVCFHISKFMFWSDVVFVQRESYYISVSIGKTGCSDAFSERGSLAKFVTFIVTSRNCICLVADNQQQELYSKFEIFGNKNKRINQR